MDHIVVDAQIAPKLGSLSETTEVRNAAGQPLGFFVPMSARPLPGEPEDTLEDLDRVYAEPGGKKLAEIWRELGVR